MPVPTLEDRRPEPGDAKEDIETPALVVDVDVMERNIREYADWADDHDVRLRSHAKTHKIPEIAHLQNRLTGGGGILCQTLSEVEVMAHHGLDDIYLSYMVVGEEKCDRYVRLSESVDDLATTVDGPGNVDPLQAAAARHDATVDVVLEIDTGLGRVGVPQGQPAVDFARYVAAQPNLNVSGVMAYDAQIKSQADGDRAELDRLATAVMDETRETVEAIEDAGVPVPEVKTGGTVTSKFSGKHPVVDEINPGMYPFNDAREMYYRPWDVGKDDVALTVLTSAISAPTDDRVVFDAGSKSISLETDTDPVPKRRDDLRYVRASEEHGWVDASEADGVAVGDRVEFIPPHVCPTVNLHDTVVGVRDDRVTEVWDVVARGKVT